MKFFEKTRLVLQSIRVHPFFTCSRSASFRMAAIFSFRAGPFKASGGGPVLSPPEAVFSTAVSPVDIVGGPERTTSPSNPWLRLKIFNFFQFSKKNKLKNNTALLCCCCRSFYFTHIDVLRHRPRRRNRSIETPMSRSSLRDPRDPKYRPLSYRI